MDCKHTDIICEHDMFICSECGEEVQKTISFGKDFKSSSPGKNNTRCIQRKSEEKNIFNDVKQYNFPQNIIDTANQFFKLIVNNDTIRGNHRVSLIFACILNSYRKHNNPISIDALKKKFNNTISNATISKGLKLAAIQLKNKGCLPSHPITPSQMIEEILRQFDATQTQIDQVKLLYKRTENRSSLLNRSRPNSVASSIVYWYMCKNNKSISLTEFSKRVNLSSLTITRLYAEITKVLNNI